MPTQETLIDLDTLFHRPEDAFDRPSYPEGLSDCLGILVEEDRSVIPSYQARPGPYFYIAHGAGSLSDEALREAEHACGMDAPPEKMYTLNRAVYGLTKVYGHNLYFISLMLSGGLDTLGPLAWESSCPGWHYQFNPGIAPLGMSGRRLIGPDGQEYDEHLSIRLTPDLVYDAAKSGGIDVRRIGLIRPSGDVEVVYDRVLPIPGSKGQPQENQPLWKPDSNFKTIRLQDITRPQGYKEIEHPFHLANPGARGVYVFQTRYPDMDTCIEDAALGTDNIVWKLASLCQLKDDPNSFIQECSSYLYRLPQIFPDSHHLGSTGRTVRVAGRNAPSDWQSEYIALDITPSMVTSALFGLGENLLQLISYDHRVSDAPWQLVYEKGTGISPSAPADFPFAEIDQPSSRPPRDLDDLFKPRGLIPD